MTDLTPNHPAVEVLARHLADLEPGDPWPTNAELGGHPLLGTRDDEFRFAMLETANEILSELISHLTTASEENLARLRDTSVGRELVAEGKSAGWDDAIKELRKGQGMQRALAGTLNTRKPNYRDSTP